jgi:hypothetical protein
MRSLIEPIRSFVCAKMHNSDSAEPLRGTLRSNENRQTGIALAMGTEQAKVSKKGFLAVSH